MRLLFLASSLLALDETLCLQQNGDQDLTTNEFHSLPNSAKAPYISLLRARGPACWDAAYYLETHQDVVDTGFNISTAWEHYVQYGQFEDRLERYALQSLKRGCIVCSSTIPSSCPSMRRHVAGLQTLFQSMFCPHGRVLADFHS